jgi:hypothetical protein
MCVIRKFCRILRIVQSSVRNSVTEKQSSTLFTANFPQDDNILGYCAYSLVQVDRRFRSTGVVRRCETPANFYETTRRHIQERCHLSVCFLENLKFHLTVLLDIWWCFNCRGCLPLATGYEWTTWSAGTNGRTRKRSVVSTCLLLVSGSLSKNKYTRRTAKGKQDPFSSASITLSW